MKATKSSAPKWNKPLSKKAYEKIIAKAKQLLRDVGWLSSWESYLTSYIDAYINDRTCHPNRHDFGEAFFVMFYAIRIDIEEAKKRSDEARRRAAERRARREAEKTALEEAAAAEARKDGEATGNSCRESAEPASPVTEPTRSASAPDLHPEGGEASPAICTDRQKTVTLHNSSPRSFTQ